MTETLGKIKERQRGEIEYFIEHCPHTDILIEDSSSGFRQRDITIRCKRCRLNLLTYVVDNGISYLSYVRDCVDGHPDSREQKKVK